jgi:rod shape-determining protein MreD
MIRWGRAGRFLAAMLVGLILQMLALPPILAPWRPLWLPLLMAYAVMTDPHLPVMFIGFAFGLATDILLDAPPGEHALALVGLGYLLLRLRATLILMPMWQITLVLGPVWTAYEFALFWLDGLTHHPANSMLRWMPALATTVAWPLLALLFDAIRRQQRVRRRMRARI